MERHFDEELRDLQRAILDMGARAQEAIRQSIGALVSRSADQARGVVARDEAIDELEIVIDEMCIDLMARHQPLARDLRFITTGMHINSDLERIADLAVDIAERVLDLAEQPVLKALVDIPRLSAVAQRMVHDAIESFVRRDVDLARRVVLGDADADALRNAIQDDLIANFLSRDPSTARPAVALLLVARHLERICDHATNIAEAVVYMVQGTVVKHHPENLSAPR
jgi:phosphate transport system protein